MIEEERQKTGKHIDQYRAAKHGSICIIWPLGEESGS